VKSMKRLPTVPKEAEQQILSVKKNH